MSLYVLKGYTVQCLKTDTCGNRYEHTRGDGRPPVRLKRCSMPDCVGRVDTTPVYERKDQHAFIPG
jgi:hypothetical protein